VKSNQPTAPRLVEPRRPARKVDVMATSTNHVPRSHGATALGDPERPQRAMRSEELLFALLSNVRRARSAFRAGRTRTVSSTTRPVQAQFALELVVAMEAYADAASRAGVPLPYRYRDELRLFKAVTGSPGQPTP
jgi:hypothetical protein